MANILTTRSSPALSVIDGIVTTLSAHIAAFFGKRHEHVMRAIEILLSQLPPDRRPNFGETVIERPNPSGGEPIKSPAYRLTRDGFTLLAMGFTGKRALGFKLAYIDAFNRMEAELRQTTLPTPTPQRWLMQMGASGRLQATPLADDVQIISAAELAEQAHQARIAELRNNLAAQEREAKENRDTLFIYEKFARPGDRTKWLSHIARAAQADWYAEDVRDKLRALGVDVPAPSALDHTDGRRGAAP